MLRPAMDMATAMMVMDTVMARGLPRLSPAMGTAMVMDTVMARGLPRLSPAMATAMVVMDTATARGLPAMGTAMVMDMAMARGLLMLRPATDMAMVMDTVMENTQLQKNLHSVNDREF